MAPKNSVDKVKEKAVENIPPLEFDKPKEDMKAGDNNIVPEKTKTMLELNEMSPGNYERSEMVINEIMIQKQCSREEAARILTNPNK